jgi:hypothetical protein
MRLARVVYIHITMSTVKMQSEVSKPWYLSERGYHPSSLYGLWYHKHMVPAMLFPINSAERKQICTKK